MSLRFVYHCTWDARKEASNARKHRVRFELAASVLHDPLARSRYDEAHSQTEVRWVTLGQAETGQLLVLIHTFEEMSDHEARVRIISARTATAHERAQYQNHQNHPHPTRA